MASRVPRHAPGKAALMSRRRVTAALAANSPSSSGADSSKRRGNCTIQSKGKSNYAPKGLCLYRIASIRPLQ